MCMPTSYEPVKVMPSTPGLPINASPTVPTRASRQRHREVERRDHHPDTMRAQTAHVRGLIALERITRHGEDEPLVSLHGIAVVADQVGRLLHVAQRLQAVLADVERVGGRKGVHALLDQVHDLPEQADPVLPLHPAPDRKGCSRGRDGIQSIPGGSLGDASRGHNHRASIAHRTPTGN